jgi:predicted permease
VRSALERLRTSPGVAEAAAINTLPLAREARILLRVDPEGVADRATSESRHSAPYLVVSPGYFRTMGIPLLLGRDLTWSDSAALKVAVINRTLAQRFWPGEDAIGKRFLFMDLRTVVGVVDDARTSDLWTDVEPQVYLPIQEQPQHYLSLVARHGDSAEVSALPAQIRAAVRAVDPGLPIYAAEPMESLVAETLAPRRINTILVSMFGAAAVGLAAVGVYGLLAWSVARRTRELGVRVALGAQRREVLALVIRQGLALVAAGVGIGVTAAMLATRYLEGMLYGVTPYDPATYAAVAGILVVVGAAASFVPARRAAAADPLTAIRAD